MPESGFTVPLSATTADDFTAIWEGADYGRLGQTGERQSPFSFGQSDFTERLH